MKMTKIALAMVVAAANMGLSGIASAASGTLTADNQFAVYTGNATGSNLQLVGSGGNWMAPFNVNFDVSAGDYLYVAATNWGGPRGWQGVFSTPVGTIYTDPGSWVVTAANDLSVTASVIAAASWTPTNELNTYGWGSIVGDTHAQWIWGAGTDTALFRTAAVVASVPEPETYAMLMAGLGLMGAVARRRRNERA